MANYNSSSEEVISNVQGYGAEVEESIRDFLADSESPEEVVVGQYETVDEALADKTSSIVVLKLPEGTDARTFQFDDSDLDAGTEGRIYIFEGEDGVTVTFNTVDRVIVGTEGDDSFTVNGDHDTTVEGGLGNDTITTTGGDDVILGGAGNDSIAAGEGNDSIFGGTGADTATFAGNQADYTIVQNGAVTVVTNTASGDVTQLVNTESLTFDDGDLSVELSSEVTALVTLYQQMFSSNDERTDGQADLEGLQYWTTEVENGLSLGGAVQWMLSGEESGAPLLDLDMSVEADRGAAIDALFNGVLGREADGDEFDYWSGQLTSGDASIESFAQDLVESDEFQNSQVDEADMDFMKYDPTNDTGFVF